MTRVSTELTCHAAAKNSIFVQKWKSLWNETDAHLWRKKWHKNIILSDERMVATKYTSTKEYNHCFKEYIVFMSVCMNSHSIQKYMIYILLYWLAKTSLQTTTFRYANSCKFSWSTFFSHNCIPVDCIATLNSFIFYDAPITITFFKNRDQSQ